MIYGFTDHQLLNAIIKANKSGKKVDVLIEPHPYKAEDENEYAISRLQDAHVNLQFANPNFKLTHQKTFTFDNQRAIIMTFNLTHSTFKNERNFALIIDDPAIVKEINEVFQTDWQRKESHYNNSVLIWSPEHSQNKILEFIRSAKNTIDVYAQDLSDYKIIGALAKSAREDKMVRILLSAKRTNYPNKKLAYLRRAGVEIHFSHDLIIHAKVIIIDHEQALLGSTNFTYPSMQMNRELSIITHDSNVVNKLIKTFNHDY